MMLWIIKSDIDHKVIIVFNISRKKFLLAIFLFKTRKQLVKFFHNRIYFPDNEEFYFIDEEL